MAITTDQRDGPSTRPVDRPATRREIGGDVTAGRAPLTKSVLANVVLLTMIAPLATDMYVPAFPMVGHDLDTGATEVQLTLTTFFVGMALGQLVGGPVSDQHGRRGPLLASLAVMTLASMVCALSPAIGVMMHGVELDPATWKDDPEQKEFATRSRHAWGPAVQAAWGTSDEDLVAAIAFGVQHYAPDGD
jgi:MFS family permease